MFLDKQSQLGFQARGDLLFKITSVKQAAICKMVKWCRGDFIS